MSALHHDGGFNASTPDERPPVGHGPLTLAALTIGLVLMSLQLWLLTVALDLLLAGRGDAVWQPALVSGLIFVGGLGMLWILHRRPRVHGVTVE